MAEKNGWLMKFLVTAIWGILTTTMIVTVTNVIANDKLSRERDIDLEHKVDKAVLEQLSVNQNILVTLKEIQVEQRYIKKAIESNGH